MPSFKLYLVSSEGSTFTSTTNPKPRGNYPSACSGTRVHYFGGGGGYFFLVLLT